MTLHLRTGTQSSWRTSEHLVKSECESPGDTGSSLQRHKEIKLNLNIMGFLHVEKFSGFNFFKCVYRRNVYLNETTWRLNSIDIDIKSAWFFLCYICFIVFTELYDQIICTNELTVLSRLFSRTEKTFIYAKYINMNCFSTSWKSSLNFFFLLQVLNEGVS